MSQEIKMSSFEIPKSATHFMYESDEYRAHFLQVDEAGNVFAEFVPSVNYIGWDFDIELYPLPVNAIPVSAYCEINRLVEENKRLRGFVEEVAELDIETFYFETRDGDADYIEYICTDIVDDANELLSELGGE